MKFYGTNFAQKNPIALLFSITLVLDISSLYSELNLLIRLILIRKPIAIVAPTRLLEILYYCTKPHNIQASQSNASPHICRRAFLYVLKRQVFVGFRPKLLPIKSNPFFDFRMQT